MSLKYQRQMQKKARESNKSDMTPEELTGKIISNYLKRKKKKLLRQNKRRVNTLMKY